MKTTTPFTYSVYCIPTGQYYYGVRHAKGCHPNDLWTKYFTSSRYVKELIDAHGKESFIIKVRKTFDSKEKALKHEEMFLKRTKAAQSAAFINKSNGAKNFYCTGHSEESRIKRSLSQIGVFHKEETKIKMSASAKGRKKSQEARQKMSAAKKGKPLTNEHKKKLSESRSGNKHHMYGKSQSEATKKLISESLRKEKSPWYGKIGDKSPYSKEYVITHPNGSQYIIKGINEFCRNHKLNTANMLSVANGKQSHHKGFRCEHYIEGKSYAIYGEFNGSYKGEKKYIITHPTGEKETIVGLVEFCKKYQLSTGNMCSVANNKRLKHKGFMCEYA